MYIWMKLYLIIMALYDYLRQPLTFYDSESKKYFRRTLGGTVEKALLQVSNKTFHPFQILKLARITEPLTSIILTNEYGTDTDITSLITSSLSYSQTAGYVTYKANDDLSEDLPTGVFSCRVSDGVFTWYSDKFKIVDLTTGNYTYLYYSNTSDNWNFLYQLGFQNRLYLPCRIEHEDYNDFRREFTNRYQQRFINYQIINPVYSIRFFCTYPLLLAIYNMMLHDTVYIKDEQNVYLARIDYFEEPEVRKLSEGTDLYEVTLKFTTDNGQSEKSSSNTNVQLINYEGVIIDEANQFVTDENNNKVSYTE